MSDIVERLRAGISETVSLEQEDLLAEAADEIERLRFPPRNGPIEVISLRPGMVLRDKPHGDIWAAFQGAGGTWLIELRTGHVLPNLIDVDSDDFEIVRLPGRIA